PKQNRDGKICRDREHVPHERAAKVLPDAPVVRYRCHVPRHPEPDDGDAWENRRADNCKKRHRLCGTIDRRTPLLAKQKQDRRDQCAGVSDTDPENEVGDVPGPADRDLISPCADAGGNLIANAKKAKRGNARSSHETHPPPPRRGLFDNAGNTLREPIEIAPVQDQGNMRDSPLCLLDFRCCCWYSVHTKSRYSGNFSTRLAMPTSFASGIFGFGLRRRAR